MKSGSVVRHNKDILGVAMGTLLILSIPFVAMHFTSEVDWNLGDFIIIGALLFGTGLAYVLVARRTPAVGKRVLIGGILAVVMLLIWAELAVGVFGTPFAGN